MALLQVCGEGCPHELLPSLRPPRESGCSTGESCCRQEEVVVPGENLRFASSGESAYETAVGEPHPRGGADSARCMKWPRHPASTTCVAEDVEGTSSFVAVLLLFCKGQNLSPRRQIMLKLAK